MRTRSEVIKDVINAFLGMNGEEEMLGSVLEDDEIEILTQTINEALTTNENKN